MNIKYERIADYELPNLTLKDKKEGIINRYGYLRLAYLKKENNSLYTTLVMKDELTNHLISVSEICEERFNELMKNYKKSDSKLSEKNKELNPVEWFKLMNNYKFEAEEIIIKELIYV